MRNMVLKILLSLLVLVIVIGVAVYIPKDDPASPFQENNPAPPLQEDRPGTLTRVGQSAPDFETTTIDGQKIRLSDQRGKVVMTAFFATWCPPCKKELPMLEKELWAEFKNEKFMILALAREQTEADVRPFKAEHNLTFTLATDPDRTAFAKYAKQGIPRTYLIAPDGKIAYQGAGYNKEDIPEIKQIIKDLLKNI